MNVIAADDEKFALGDLMTEIRAAHPNCTLNGFDNPRKALEFAKENDVDVAFLDIEMRAMNGLVLAKNFKEINAKINIIFVTGFSQYALEAMTLRPSGYVMKPVSQKKILAELENLRNPLKNDSPTMQLRVRCFGNFEVFFQNEPVSFARSKTKELLAYLVDRRGARISADELTAVLWEDRPNTSALRSNFRNVVADLSGYLSSIGAEAVLFRDKRYLSVRVDQIACDYYDYLDGDMRAINRYAGEYMKQYSWAEMTIAVLERE